MTTRKIFTSETLLPTARPPTGIKCIQERVYKMFFKNSTVFDG